MHDSIIWSPGMTIEALEKLVILKAFRFYRGQKTTTSNSLGISIRTLDNKLDKYKLEEEEEQKRLMDESNKRIEQLERARGKVPNNVFTGTSQTQESYSASTGVRMESAVKVTAQPAMSMQKRQKI